jgi:hypothetical protein
MAMADEYARLDDVIAAGPRGQLLAEAIRVLTEAARLTRPVLELDEQASETSGSPTYRESGRTEPDDWAEFVTQALAGAAANIGSVETVLAGRPGSWEADGVRQLLLSTVGHSAEYLAEHRTEPLVIDLYVDEVLVDVGHWKTYRDAEGELARRQREAGLTRDATPAELEQLPGSPIRFTRDWSDEQEQLAEQLFDLQERLEDQREADAAAYGAALADAIRAAAARQPGLTVPVDVRIDLDTIRPPGGGGGLWWGLADELLAQAIAATPVPGDGRPPLERLQPVVDQDDDAGVDLRACCDHQHVDHTDGQEDCPVTGCDCNGEGPTVAVDEQGRPL